MRLNVLRLSWTLALGAALVSGGVTVARAEDAPKPAASPAPAPAEKPKAPEPPARAPRAGDIQRVFTIENARPGDLARVLQVFPATIKTSDRPPAIGVSASPAVVAAIEATIKRLDVAPSSKDVELTGYVIRAERKSSQPDDVPEALASAVSQMRSLFGYGRFELLDVLVGRGASGQSRIELTAVGAKRLLAGAAPAPTYSLSARPLVTSQETSTAAIRLDDLKFGMQVPVAYKSGDGVSFNFQHAGMRADIEVRPDQCVVVGKTGLGDDSGDALILVIKARLVD